MRKHILLLLFLICFTSSIFAQVHFTPYVYYNAHAGSSWTKGTYITMNGLHYSGYILFSERSDKKLAGIMFKKEKHDDKIVIPIDSVTEVDFEKDTFNVSHSPLLNSPFVTMVIGTNNLKLYHQYASAFSYSGVKDIWYYGINKDDLTLLDKKNFLTAMPQIMADKQDVVKNITNKTYKYSDMVDLITYYQTGREPWITRRDEGDQ